MPTRPERESAIQLRGGESLFVYLRTGSTLVSSSGQLRLTGDPRWLAGQVFRTQTTLAEGEAWLLEESGWVTLASTGGGTTVHICRSEAPSQLGYWLHKAVSMVAPGRTARTCA